MSDADRREPDSGAEGGAEPGSGAELEAPPGPTFSYGGKELTLEELEALARNGSGWFYWIAGLSILNTIVLKLGTEWSMIIGLGITQLFDFLPTMIFGEEDASTARTILEIATGAISIGIAAVFAVLGLFARKVQTWPFYVGLPIYALDTLVFVLIQAWFAVVFHGFVLLMLWGGLMSTRAVLRARAELAAGAVLVDDQSG